MTRRAAVLELGPPRAWTAALDAWDEHRRGDGYAVTTRARQRRYLAAVARNVPDPWRATAAALEAALSAAGYAPPSARDARGAVRAFYAWAYASGQVPANPARDLRSAPTGPVPVEPAPRAVRVVRQRRRSVEAPPMPPAWAAAFDQWQAWWAASSRSAGTMRMRRHQLAHLAQLVGPDPWSATTGQLVEFMARPGWSPATRKTVRSTLRGFYRWAVTVGLTERDPARPLPAVAVPDTLPRPAPAAVVAGAVERGTPRERLMVELARDLGLRCAEVAGVHTDDVEGDLLRVRGKGGRERLVPLPPELLARLRALPRGWVFLNPRTGRPLLPASVGKILAELLRHPTEPGAGWSAHTLRHAACSGWYEGTGDIYVVSELAGHARIDTTRIYTRLPSERLRAAMASAPEWRR